MEAQDKPRLSQQFVEIMVLLHNQFGVLCTLMDTAGMTITDISRQLNISKQQMTNIIDKLVCADYVHKEPDDKDRRRIVITISSKGQQLLDDHMELFRQRFDYHAQNLTKNERQELAQILRRYYELINKMFA